MIAKLVVHGRDRTEALRMLRRGLEEYKVVGVSTNIEFLRTLAGNNAFIAGDVETGFIKKHHSELFPLIPEPSPELLAQAALYVALRDQTVSSTLQSPWTSLGARRFGGDAYERTVTLSKDDPSAAHINISLKYVSPGHFDITVNGSSPTIFKSVSARLISPTTLEAFSTNMTIVSQPPASTSPNTMERLHLFAANGTKTTLTLPPPAWLLSLGGDVLATHKGALRAPMPSLVVEVRVSPGQRVDKGQAVVVLESMKTETVLRAEVAGIVKSVGCAKGEMVEEGKELVDIEEDATEEG